MIFLFLLLFVKFQSQATAVQNVNQSKIYVHLIPHTHVDPGWLKTYEQYFYGLNSTVCVGAVQYILDAVVQSLLKNHERRFIFAEISFFEV